MAMSGVPPQTFTSMSANSTANTTCEVAVD